MFFVLLAQGLERGSYEPDVTGSIPVWDKWGVAWDKCDFCGEREKKSEFCVGAKYLGPRFPPAGRNGAVPTPRCCGAPIAHYHARPRERVVHPWTGLMGE